jgi:hypothetical protein
MPFSPLMIPLLFLLHQPLPGISLLQGVRVHKSFPEYPLPPFDPLQKIQKQLQIQSTWLK